MLNSFHPSIHHRVGRSPWTVRCLHAIVAQTLFMTSQGMVAASPTQPSTSHEPVAYRCESSSANGAVQVLYQAQPCGEVSFSGHPLQARDLRSGEQQADAIKASQSASALARQLEHERRTQEKRAAHTPAIALTTPHPPLRPGAAIGSSAQQGQTLKRSRHFRALVPKSAPSARQGLRKA